MRLTQHRNYVSNKLEAMVLSTKWISLYLDFITNEFAIQFRYWKERNKKK